VGLEVIHSARGKGDEEGVDSFRAAFFLHCIFFINLSDTLHISDIAVSHRAINHSSAGSLRFVEESIKIPIDLQFIIMPIDTTIDISMRL